jgi:hypothetical protein
MTAENTAARLGLADLTVAFVILPRSVCRRSYATPGDAGAASIG